MRAATREKRREHGKRMFTAAQVATILEKLDREAGDPRRGRYAKVMRAMFLLGLNGGYGQSDVAAYRPPPSTSSGGRSTYDRVETHEYRIVPLWRATADALREAIVVRPNARNAADTRLNRVIT